MTANEPAAPWTRVRVLWVSDSPRLHTGFGRASDEILRRVAAIGLHNLGVLGWDAAPRTDGKNHGYLELAPGPSAWSSEQIDRTVSAFGPDVVVTLGPLFAQRAMAGVTLRPFVRWLGYVVFEAAPPTLPDFSALRGMDGVAVPSTWCKESLERGAACEKVRVISHGVDAETFHPFADRHALRERAGLAGKFVVGCVARNEFRKQIPILLEAFAHFAEHHPDAVLYLHMDPDASDGWRLLELVERYGIARRTAFTRGLAQSVGVGLEQLNAIYNLFDVMVLPTMGEGFGLPLLEAMAAGVPVMATDCSGVSELVRDRGELIAVREWVTMTWDNARYALADGGDITDRLEKLYRDRDLLAEYAQRGRVFAEAMTWDSCVAQWLELMESVTAIGARAGRPLEHGMRVFGLDDLAQGGVSRAVET